MATLSRLLLVIAGLVLMAGLGMVGTHYPILILLALGGAAWGRGNARGPGTSHGSARLASLFDLMRAGMLGRDGGLIFGRATLVERPGKAQAVRCLLSPLVSSAIAIRMASAAFGRRPDAGLIRIHNLTHAITVAPSGAGKSTGVLVPNLLSFRGSCVVIDPKGELFKLTSSTRSHSFNHRIIRIDPFGLAGNAANTDALNPLDFIDEHSLSFYDDCRALADLLVLQRGTEADPHWNSRSIDVLTAFIVFVCALEADPAKRNLLLVRDLLAAPHRFREVLKVMAERPDFEGVLSLLGHNLQWLQDRELASVLSTVSRHTSWLFSPAVSAAIGRSSFEPRSLWSGRVTVYIILPPDKLATLAPMMRMWLGTLITLVSRNGGTERYPVLFLIDEAASLGRMQPIQDAFSIARGYGIKIWLFLQSLDQLKQCYGDAASIILDNAGTQQYFGITSLDTCDHLSKRIGDATILTESFNRNASRSRQVGMAASGSPGSVSTGDGTTISPQARRLLRPEEILVAPRRFSLVFHKNLIIPAELAEYHNSPEFAKGRTGRARRIGLRALAAAGLVLLACLAMAAVLLSLPALDALRQSAFDRPGYPAAGRTPPSGIGSYPQLEYLKELPPRKPTWTLDDLNPPPPPPPKPAWWQVWR